MPSDPVVSVIVPVYNGSETLPLCLTALQQQSHPPDEIIVIDDGSTDDSADIAAGFGVGVSSGANAGPAVARNRGAMMAQGDILLFTDADCAPVSDWVEQMVRPFADPEIAGAKGTYATRQKKLVPRFVQQEYQDRYDRMAGQTYIDFIDTYSAAYRRDCFVASGGFDTSFPTASVEDQEFSFRLAEKGYKLVYVPGARVYHQHDQNLWAYAHRKYGIGYWKARVTARYPDKLVQDSHTPQILKVQLGLFFLGGGFLMGGGLAGYGPVWVGGLLVWVALLLSGWRFYQKILRRDAAVLVIAPLMLWVRACALGIGFFWGNCRLLWDKLIANNDG